MVFGVSKILGGFMAVLEKIASWVGALFSIIPKTLYLLITFAMQIVDIIQLLFQKLAGLDVYYIEGSDNPETGDFLIYFLRKVLFEKGTLNTVFWSIVILGLFLLVFATIVAVIRTQYTYDEKPVSPTKVVGQAIKSLISFAIVPLVAFFGVYLGNIFLQALNSATEVSAPGMEFAETAKIKLKPYTLANGKKTYAGINLFGTNLAMNNETFSGMVFRAASYRANRIRNNADFRALCDGSKETATVTGVYSGVTFGMFEVTANDYETAATRLDDAFVYNYRLDQSAYVNWAASAETALTMSVGVLFNDFTAALYAIPYQTFSRYNVAWVWFYYDLWQFDYVMAIIAIVALAIIYLNITSAMMKRAIELTMLMIMSPAVVAVTPLDGGAMQKRWKDNFIKKTLSAYGAVVGTNLLFIILPIIRDINFFNIPIVDTIVQLLFTIVGLTCIKDFMKMMSELVGGEDANAVGGEVNKKIADTAVKVGTAAASVANPAAGALKGMMKKNVAKGLGKGMSSGISKLSARGKARRDQTKALKAEGKTKEQIKDMRKADRAEWLKRSNEAAKHGLAGKKRSEYLKNGNYKLKDDLKQRTARNLEQQQYSKFTKDLEQREKNKYIRGLMAEDSKKGISKDTKEYEKMADEYIASQAGQDAIAKREHHREQLQNAQDKAKTVANKAAKLAKTPLRFMGTLAGQVVDGTYGDKVYDGYKGMKNAYEGKSTGAFFGAMAKDKKAEKEKEEALKQQEKENTRQDNMLSTLQSSLSAQEQANALVQKELEKVQAKLEDLYKKK